MKPAMSQGENLKGMREIKFRGRDAKGVWHYGYFSKDYGGTAYITTLDGVDTAIVDEETIGQFIGMHDKNGKEIYEGDCFREDDTILVVVWNNDVAKFQIDMYGHDMYRNEGGGEEFRSEISKIDEDVFDIYCLVADEVIGNIDENPELITALNRKEVSSER